MSTGHLRGARRAQTAIEYLTTYGWAILIIATVLGAFFSLGVFNSTTFLPRALAGACQVNRPGGVGSALLINLNGVCNGAYPQSVAYFKASPAGYVTVNAPVGLLNTAAGGTNAVSFWMNWTGGSGQVPFGFGKYGILTSATCIGFTTGSGDIYGTSANGIANTWVMVTANFKNGAVTNSIYINGMQSASCGSSAASGNVLTNGMGLVQISGTRADAGQVPTQTFQGEISNVQIYNTSLSSAEISAIYHEKIGGAPIRLQNLVGWWQLNGDVNDYGGANLNGQSSGLTFSNTWINSYAR
ncbi:Concanavalin A-like lectin/glucanases superfamily protein [uncultured archaeon]|nr:Concanavalin A-like lectin/glucanases superfamily protein [uncultured archaeon]